MEQRVENDEDDSDNEHAEDKDPAESIANLTPVANSHHSEGGGSTRTFYTWGVDFMIWTQFVDDMWVPCVGTCKDKVADSYANRYHLSHQFLPHDVEEDDDTTEYQVEVKQLRKISVHSGTGNSKSHWQMIYCFSLFERYILEVHNTSCFARDLVSWLKMAGELNGKRVHFKVSLFYGSVDNVVFQFVFFSYISQLQPPAYSLLLSYCVQLRNGGLKGKTIKLYMTSIKSACLYFGSCFQMPNDIYNMIASYMDMDTSNASSSFDFVDDLPRLFNACWELPGHDNEDKLKYWTMFLISIVMMARASEVTTFCPLYEDLELPTSDQQYWDSDGIPKYILVTLRYSWIYSF
jgi:hypothetical protein